MVAERCEDLPRAYVEQQTRHGPISAVECGKAWRKTGERGLSLQVACSLDPPAGGANKNDECVKLEGCIILLSTCSRTRTKSLAGSETSVQAGALKFQLADLTRAMIRSVDDA